MNNPTLNDYFTQLDSNTLILTPNSRLAVVLQNLYGDYQLKQSKKSWVKPNILSIKAWQESLWRDYVASCSDNAAPYLLNNAQAHLMWETIISNDDSHQLLQVSETAKALKTAWELIHQFQVDIHDPAFQTTEDYALCQRWMLQYQVQCHEYGYLDSATLVDFLAERMTSGDMTPPSKIWLYGFAEVVPQFKKLLGNSGAVKTLDPSQKHAGMTSSMNPNLVASADSDSEIIAMARFAKAIHEAQPNAKIGCVLLDLGNRRDRVLQLFLQVFFPEHPFDIDPAQFPFNISAGKSLASYPIIKTALQITGLNIRKITREQFSQLLLSPYIASADTEAAQRTKFDAKLRRDNIHLVELNRLGGDCEKLIEHLKVLLELVDDEKRTYQAWSQHFNNMLAAMGWPGEKSLSSEEYQVAHAWLTALTDLASLDKLSPPVDKQTAWQQLKLAVTGLIFQPQSPSSNIQILGMLEAAAVPFDYLWVAGTNDLNWPAQPKPNPFIPKALQRELNMPHATAERELHFCSELLKQFRESASELIFSYAKNDGKVEYRPSTLLEDSKPTTLKQLAQCNYDDLSELIFNKREHETFTDNTAPALPTGEKIMGGADAIKQQAACPFKAFATYRLQARELESSTQGLNQKNRGVILHDAMQYVWGEIESQNTLLDMVDEQLTKTVDEAIIAAINKNAPSHHQQSNYIDLERLRLKKIILQWLELEKARPPFTVSHCEEMTTIELLGHPLTVRIDRIDTLASGDQLILDYKSGRNNSDKKWFGDRPDEPQLPLYALINPAQTVGISFVQLAAGDARFKGISNGELSIKGIKNEAEVWAYHLQVWRATINNLVTDFCAGEAIVNPKRPSETCKHCAITPLCRIYELDDPDNDDESAELGVSYE